MVDNASDDGSADAVEAWNAGPATASGRGCGCSGASAARARRPSTACCSSEARGELCLLLNEDSELRAGRGRGAARGAARRPRRRAPRAPSCVDPAGATAALRVAAAGARRRARRARSSCTGGWWSRAAASARARSAGCSRRRCWSADAAAARGRLPRPRRSSSTPTRRTSAKRLHDAGWRILHVPGAVAVHHEQLATDAGGAPTAADGRVPPRARPLSAQAPRRGAWRWRCGR